MKLALLGPAYPLRGGIAHYLAHLYHAAVDSGHQVYFASFAEQYFDRLPHWPVFQKLRFPGSSQLEAAAKEVDERWIVPCEPLFVPWSPRSWQRTAAAIAQSGAAVCVIKWWVPYFAPGFAAVARQLARRQIPTVAILDNVTPHEHWPMARWLTRTSLAAVTGYVAQSQAVAQDLTEVMGEVSPDRLALAHHPTYDFGPPKAASPAAARRQLGIKETHVILFFGFIKPYKGLMVLFEATPHLREVLGDDFRVLVVGDFYEDRAPYDARLAELGISDRVTLHGGYLPNAQVADTFLAADVMALPYLSATQSGIVQIAYRYDRPVVATRVGGIPEVVENGRTGALVPPNDPKALASALVEILTQSDRQAMATAIQRKRRDYSWEALVETLVDLGERLEPGAMR